MKFPPDPLWAPSWFGRARRNNAARYGFALLSTTIAAFAWNALAQPFSDQTPYQVLLLFVAVAAWFGGMGPGVVTTALCAVWALWHHPAGHIALAQELETSLFFPTGLFLSALCGSLHRARNQALDFASLLAISQQRYQSIVETAAEGIWAVDLDLKTTFVNGRMAQILGTTPEAMLGRPVADFLWPEDLNSFAKIVAERDFESPYQTERRYRRANGEEIWLAVNANPLRDANGRLEGTLALHTDVTERRQQTAALRESNQRFETATRAVDGYIYDWDFQTGVVWRSSGFFDVMGYDSETVPATAEWWSEKHHPDDRERLDLNGEHTLIHQDHYAVEYRARHADGSYRWLWDRGVVARNEDGKPRRVIGSVADITARREVVNALRQSEANFRQLADSMPQIVWTCDSQGIPDYFNQRWYDYTGQTTGVVGPDSWIPVYHPNDRELAVPVWKECLKNAAPLLLERRLRDRDGAYHWFLCRCIPIKDPSTGEAMRWFGTATDIDDQKRAADTQKFLADAGTVLSSSLDYEETLQRVANLAVPAMADWCFVVLKNAAGNPQMLAAAHQENAKIAAFWKRHLKYGLDPEAPRGFAGVMRSGQPELVEEMNPDVWRGVVVSEGYQSEVAEVGHRSTLIVPLLTGDRVFGSIGFSYAESDRHFSQNDIPFAQEIARRAAIAIENARLYRELQQADRRKDEFLAMLAHELRNPLAAITSASAVLDGLLQGEARTDTETPRSILERQSHNLSRLVDDLLDVSRITRGKIELRRENLDFGAIIKSALDGVSSLIESYHHDLTVHWPDEEVRVDGDPARLSQIVSNLVTNAAKYTEPGGKIEIWLETQGNEAIFRVRDNGMGLPPELLGSIWELFVQSDRTLDRAQGGLGIGLTLIRSLTEMHGGRVGVASEGLGKGSEFLVALPLLAVPALSAETEPGNRPAQKKPVASENPEKRRVLVVDDNFDGATMLATWLKFKGYTAQCAYSGEDGLRTATEWQPDVVLLDIGMPGMNGYEVAQSLRQSPLVDGILLIAVTGYGQVEDRRRTKEAGFDFHLTKPVEIEELTKLIEDRLGKK